MAVGGALRAAMKAGNFVKVASESRRRARALAELNARGGIRGSSQMDSLWNRGFEQPFAPGGLMSGYTPRGHHVIGNEATGARFVRDFQHSPIQAPYEGVRTFPQSGYNEPSPFMGRGRAPSFRDVLEPRNYGDGADFIAEPFVFDPFGNNSFMNVPRAFGGTANYNSGFASRYSPAYNRGIPTGSNPFGPRYLPFEQVMRTLPMDYFNDARNIPF